MSSTNSAALTEQETAHAIGGEAPDFSKELRSLVAQLTRRFRKARRATNAKGLNRHLQTPEIQRPVAKVLLEIE